MYRVVVWFKPTTNGTIIGRDVCLHTFSLEDKIWREEIHKIESISAAKVLAFGAFLEYQFEAKPILNAVVYDEKQNAFGKKSWNVAWQLLETEFPNDACNLNRNKNEAFLETFFNES